MLSVVFGFLRRLIAVVVSPTYRASKPARLLAAKVIEQQSIVQTINTAPGNTLLDFTTLIFLDSIGKRCPSLFCHRNGLRRQGKIAVSEYLLAM